MALPHIFENVFHTIVNGFFAAWPRSRPDEKRMAECKIISHRGEHDNIDILENTLPAFDGALALGACGVELDVRWTSDPLPVVFHDPDLGRLFNKRDRLRDISLETLRTAHPTIPTLETIIRKYGGKLHLMVEIKEEHYPDPAGQARTLERLFSHLTPALDYHLISLTPRMFRYVDFAPRDALIPIGGLDIRRMSRLALRKNLGGLLGHYFLLTKGLMKKHVSRGQGIGVGYADSRNVLYREIRRGVDWIFSNNAGEMCSICGEKTADGPPIRVNREKTNG